MTRPRSFSNSACTRVQNPLKAGYLRLREDVVKRITVIHLGVNGRGDNGTCCCEIEMRMDTCFIILLSPVYTIQLVVKPVVNRFDNKLYRVNGVSRKPEHLANRDMLSVPVETCL